MTFNVKAKKTGALKLLHSTVQLNNSIDLEVVIFFMLETCLTFT